MSGCSGSDWNLWVICQFESRRARAFAKFALGTRGDVLWTSEFLTMECTLLHPVACRPYTCMHFHWWEHSYAYVERECQFFPPKFYCPQIHTIPGTCLQVCAGLATPWNRCISNGAVHFSFYKTKNKASKRKNFNFKIRRFFFFSETFWWPERILGLFYCHHANILTYAIHYLKNTWTILTMCDISEEASFNFVFFNHYPQYCHRHSHIQCIYIPHWKKTTGAANHCILLP